jgi:hypothetical protein
VSLAEGQEFECIFITAKLAGNENCVGSYEITMVEGMGYLLCTPTCGGCVYEGLKRTRANAVHVRYTFLKE